MVLMDTTIWIPEDFFYKEMVTYEYHNFMNPCNFVTEIV